MLRDQVRPSDQHFNINVSLSDSISLDRTVPDTRPQACKALSYDIDELPRASVIVPFYNEALSMLLRTVHSILNRSPDKLLAEVRIVEYGMTSDL